MNNLKFSDGESFDTSAPLHAEHRYDGWYVVGGNKLIPVKDLEEAKLIIERCSIGKN